MHVACSKKAVEVMNLVENILVQLKEREKERERERERDGAKCFKILEN